MRKIFTLLFAVCLSTLSWAQLNAVGTVAKAESKPVIDGSIDAVWSTTEKVLITRNFQSELPTLGPEGTTYFKGLWDEDGFYLFIYVNDDAWYPAWAVTPAGTTHEYDKVEIYFDTNYLLADGVGGRNLSTTGHRQFAPNAPEAKDYGKAQEISAAAGKVKWAYNVMNPAYSVEFFVPWLSIPDKDGFFFDKTGEMGFDITVIDRDPGDTSRKRANWSNEGKANENWNNMDDAGRLTFIGAEATVYVDNIKIAAGQQITVDNGTLEIAKEIIPADATYPALTWSIVAGGTGKASIDAKTGVLKAITNGTILVKAAATDGGYAESDVAEITISGQIVNKSDLFNSFNRVKNWDFNNKSATDDTPTDWGNMVQTDAATGLTGAVVPKVQEGVAVCVAKKATDGNAWKYQLYQNILKCEPNVPYVFRFKAWADANDIPANVDFEDDTANRYARYGLSSDANAIGGKTDWNFTLSVEPTWFQMNIDAFDKILADTQEQFQFNFAGATATIYVDSVILVKKEEWQMSAKSLANAKNSLRVYPNPVGSANELTVSLAVAKGTVGIYNSIGQKLMEKAATSDNVKFNVSNLRKGVYFVRLSDGTTQKFVR